jgi:cytochrome P450
MKQEIRGYEAVKAAAKDFETYSSDLQGDRDVRNYRQLPLEADPPRHALFRDPMQRLFTSELLAPKIPKFEELAKSLIAEINQKGHAELGKDLALPYVIGCLTIIYNRPQDYAEWLSWGPDVWLAEAYSKGLITPDSQRAHRERNFEQPTQRSGVTLQSYLTRVFDAADENLANGELAKDLWDDVCRLEVNDQRVNREEMLGIANVMLAGGRDTVIKLLTGLTWHLMKSAQDRQYLAENPDALNGAIAELIRYLSPLAKMERVVKHEDGTQEYVLLNFLSANYDTSIFENPEQIDIKRGRNPHLGFGFGRHTCLGLKITDYEAKAFLKTLLDNWPNWQFDGEPDIEWITDGEGADAIQAIERFNEVRVKAF